MVIDDFYGWENSGSTVDDKAFTLTCKHPHCCFHLSIFFWHWLKISNFKIGLSSLENAISAKWIFWIVVVWVKTKNKVDFNSIYDLNQISCWHILGVCWIEVMEQNEQGELFNPRFTILTARPANISWCRNQRFNFKSRW